MILRKPHHCGSALISVLLVRVAAYLWWFAPTGALYAAYLPEFWLQVARPWVSVTRPPRRRPRSVRDRSHRPIGSAVTCGAKRPRIEAIA